MVWCRQVIGQRPDQGDVSGVVIMVGPHHRDGMRDAGTAPCAHGRKQDHFLLGHVTLQLLRQCCESAGQPDWRIGIVRVDPFDPVRKRYKRRELPPVRVVIARQDVVDQGAGLLRGLGFAVVFHRGVFRRMAARSLCGVKRIGIKNAHIT